MQASTSFTPAGRLEALEIHSADYTVDFYRLGNLMESKWLTDYFYGKLKGKTTGTFCGGLLLRVACSHGSKPPGWLTGT